MTARQLHAALDRWQQRLGTNWAIAVKLVPQKAFDGANPTRWVYGEVHGTDIGLHTSEIWIWRGDKPERQLETLAHEFGHLLFDPGERISDDSTFEDGLDKFARLLVACK